MPPLPAATAAVIIIGNEVLSGRTQDQNLAFLAERLASLGIPVREARIVRDEEQAIIEAVNACRVRETYVFTTGGIGPTHDDITAAAIAKAFGVNLIHRDPRAVRLLQQLYRPEDLNEARLKMASIPEGAELIDNPVSRAPGFRLENVFVLPGVPMIMRAMFDGIAAGLRRSAPLLSRTLLADTTEGTIATPLAEIQRWHADVEIGSYPFLRGGRVGVSLVVRGTDPDAVEGAVAAIAGMLRSLRIKPVEEPVVAAR